MEEQQIVVPQDEQAAVAPTEQKLAKEEIKQEELPPVAETDPLAMGFWGGKGKTPEEMQRLIDQQSKGQSDVTQEKLSVEDAISQNIPNERQKLLADILKKSKEVEEKQKLKREEERLKSERESDSPAEYKAPTYGGLADSNFSMTQFKDARKKELTQNLEREKAEEQRKQKMKAKSTEQQARAKTAQEMRIERIKNILESDVAGEQDKKIEQLIGTEIIKELLEGTREKVEMLKKELTQPVYEELVTLMVQKIVNILDSRDEKDEKVQMLRQIILKKKYVLTTYKVNDYRAKIHEKLDEPHIKKIEEIFKKPEWEPTKSGWGVVIKS